MTTPVDRELGELPEALRRTFAPLRRRALGLAVGITLGVTVFGVTAYHLVFEPAVPAHLENYPFEDDPVGHLWLLNQYFPGYDPVSWSGAFYGFLWATLVGFVLGVGIAATRNLIVYVWLTFVRARGNLSANRGFLDEI